MSRGSKGKYSDWIAEEGLLMIEGWARDGLTDKDIAEKRIGISDRTFADWKSRFPAISSCLKKARIPIAEKIENSLYNLCQTQEYTDTVVEEFYDKDNKLVSRHVKKTLRQVPPNPTAIIFALKNLKAEKWREKQDTNINVNHNGKLADLIDGLKADNDDIHEETTATNEAVADGQTEEN